MNDPNPFNLEPWRVDLYLLGPKKHGGGFQPGVILQLAAGHCRPILDEAAPFRSRRGPKILNSEFSVNP